MILSNLLPALGSVGLLTEYYSESDGLVFVFIMLINVGIGASYVL